MRAVGVTGGIASGKSLADRAFAARGIPVVDADALAREIVAPGQPALAEIVAAFGPAVLRVDGSLDRQELRRRVFAAPAERRRLEAITHPRIRVLLRERCAAAVGPYVVASIPLLAEAGAAEAYRWLGRVVVVDAPRPLQVRRLVERDGIDAVLAERMLAAQADRATRLALASDVLVNDGPPEALAQAVGRLDAALRAWAADDRSD